VTGRLALFFCGFFLLADSAFAQSYVMTDNCVKAYQAFMSTKLQEGKAWLSRETTENPGNAMPLILVNYEEYIRLTFSEDPAAYRNAKSLLDQRIKALQYTDQHSPWYLFGKGLLYFQWAVIRTKYTDYWDAAWDFRRSYLLFSENKKKFPQFRYHNVFLGAQEAIISTIPSGYRWISNILGLRGNMKSGMGMLRNHFLSAELPFREESYLFYIYLKNYLDNDIEGAMALIQQHQLDTRNNMMYLFMAANLALNNKKAAITEKLIMNRNKGSEYMNFPMLDYELADAKMKRLDFTAIDYFNRFLNQYRGYFYLKDACQSMAYCYYLMGNQARADEYKRRILRIGRTEADADKQAQRFAEKGRFPDRDLLKARLLNDGGNHQQALQTLLTRDPKTFSTEAEKLEYYYRLSRVYDDLDNETKALEFYDYTIRIGSGSTEYFAARAALQAGMLYEKKGQSAQALKYYQMVLEMGDHDFKNSLDQRAKAGINRVKGQ
jgi:hypothetical protein